MTDPINLHSLIQFEQFYQPAYLEFLEEQNIQFIYELQLELNLINIVMRHYLIGKNIQTSLSPQIHNFLFKLKSRKATYELHIQNTPLEISQMQQKSFGGTSITIPFKKYYRGQPEICLQGSLPTKLGVINTIYKDQASKLIGVNTDIFGISQCFKDKLNIVEHPKVLIIGAGATAQIFCHYFQQKKFQIHLLNRSSSKIEELKQQFTNITDFSPLKPDFAVNKALKLYSVVINTLPSEAVYQNWDHIELNLKHILKNYPTSNRTKIVYMNVNYRQKLDPIQELIKNKLSLFAETVRGIDMLLWQAVEQNRYFCNQPQLHQQEYRWQITKLRKQLHLE